MYQSKKNIMPYKSLFTAFLILVLMSSCKKNYLDGGSLHNPITPLSNIEYMRANASNLFDTSLIIIQRLGLTDQVNSAKTFFAFTDYSVLSMINLKLQQRQNANPIAVYTLDSLIKEISTDSVRQYMLDQTIDLETAPEDVPRTYTSLGRTSNAVFKQLQITATYRERTQAPTYLLFYVLVRGALDQPGVPPPTGQNDISVLCQTTGIKTSNGNTTLHVLNNQHTFVRF
jgi:hypothetical protein